MQYSRGWLFTILPLSFSMVRPLWVKSGPLAAAAVPHVRRDKTETAPAVPILHHPALVARH